jgi:hypothetical protein
MSSKSDLLAVQRRWAESHGLAVDSRGYLTRYEVNLFKPMSAATLNAFNKGSGSELRPTKTRPAKMSALHSSSALAVNVFDRWVDSDARLLATALNLRSRIQSIQFEEQFPTGLPGNPPNLDVALDLVDGHVIGIESKFSEWLTPKSKTKVPFKDKYFSAGQDVWESVGLPQSQKLAARMQNGEIQFRYLDTPQLLKHALGFATRLGSNFSLHYLYFDWPGKESIAHRDDIGRFAAQVGPELRFNALSYQDLFCSFATIPGIDKSYLDYLTARY